MSFEEREDERYAATRRQDYQQARRMQIRKDKLYVCRHCGQAIVWISLEDGRRFPCEETSAAADTIPQETLIVDYGDGQVFPLSRAPRNLRGNRPILRYWINHLPVCPAIPHERREH